MGITVREALQIGGLKDARVVAGEKGLDRIINYVLTIDVPDAAKWSRGGELLLTAAYVFASNPEMEKTFIFDLVERNTSALAIKPGRFISRIPPSIIDAANQKDFPVIELPIHVAWHDIVNPVLTEIINKETNQLKRSKLIHDNLMGVVLHGGGLESIAKSLALLLNCTVFIEDESFNLLAYATNQGLLDELSQEVINTKRVPMTVIKELRARKILDELKTYKKPRRIYYKTKPNSCSQVIAPIIINDDVYGYISLVENNTKITDFDFIAAEQASTIASLEFFKEQAVKEAEGKVKREFLENLVTGHVNDADLIKSRLRLYDIKLKETIAVIVVFLRYEDAMEIENKNFRDISCGIENQEKNYIIFRKGEKIVIIYSMTKADARKNYDKVKNMCKSILENLRKYEEVKIGISDFKKSISDIPRGYDEAKKAITISEKIKNNLGDVVFYKDVWIYDLLLATGNAKTDLNMYCDNSLFKLIEIDLKSKDENLLKTLKVYLENMGKCNVTAERLYIHRNTLNYRLNKIREILGCDLDDPATRLRLEISLKIIDILE